MAWSKAKTGIIGAVVAASLIIPAVVQYQAHAGAQAADDLLRGQAARLARLKTENDRLSKLTGTVSLSPDQTGNLERLRGEVAALQPQVGEVAQLRQENQRLKSLAGLDKPKTPMQIKEEAIAKINYGRDWVLGFFLYAEEHHGKFPANFDQAASYVSDKAKQQSEVTTDQFEIVFQGSPSSLARPQDIIVLRETEAWESGQTSHSGKWAKAYAFADGHCEIHSEIGNNFDEYEQQHMVLPSDSQ